MMLLAAILYLVIQTGVLVYLQKQISKLEEQGSRLEEDQRVLMGIAGRSSSSIDMLWDVVAPPKKSKKSKKNTKK